MVEFALYVEGGGDGGSLRNACRQGFADFLKRAGLQGRMPRVYACGARLDAYKAFTLALSQGQKAFLLIDSEGPVSGISSWEHLANRTGDAWECPPGATDDHCHLMVQVMESWFLTDLDVLENALGKFPPKHAPKLGRSIESIPKDEVFRCLDLLGYKKGKHSFKLLGCLDPKKVMQASPRAKRFIDTLSDATNGAQA